jgi:hypothetical protein
MVSKSPLRFIKVMKVDGILEIVDEGWNSTLWDDLFPTAKEALDAGIKAIEEEGIQSFIGDSKA